MASIIGHKQDLNFLVLHQKNKSVHFETLYIIFYIKNVFSVFSSISILYSSDKLRHGLLPGDLIVFYRRLLQKRTIKIIISKNEEISQTDHFIIELDK